MVRWSPRLLALLWSVDGSVRNVLVAGTVCFTAGMFLSLLLIAGGVLGLLLGYVVFVADQTQVAGGAPATRFRSLAPLPSVASAETAAQEPAAQEPAAGSAVPALPHFSIEVIERDLATPGGGEDALNSGAQIRETGPKPGADSEPGAYPEPDADLESGVGPEPGADLEPGAGPEPGTDLEFGTDLEPD